MKKMIAPALLALLALGACDNKKAADTAKPEDAAQTAAATAVTTPPLGKASTAYFYPVIHRIKTQFRGDGMCLGPYRDGAKRDHAYLDTCDGTAVRNFEIKAEDASGKTFHVVNQFREGMCLDVINGGPDDGKLGFMLCAKVSGHAWEFRPLATPGTFQLASILRPGQCADIINGGADDNDARLAPCANASGQIWVFEPVDSGLPWLAAAPKPVVLVLDDKAKKSLLALPKNRDIIITSGDQEAEVKFAHEIYAFLKKSGYDLDEPDRLMLTSIPGPVTIDMNAADPKEPITIKVGTGGF